MKVKLLLFSVLVFSIAKAQDVTITPGSLTQCVGEIQQLSATAGMGQSTLFSENFEGGTLGNFTATVLSGTVNTNSQWTNRTSPYTPPTTVWNPIINSGSMFALSNSDYSGASVNTALESGVLNTTGYTSLTLAFRHFYSDFSTTNDFTYIEASIDGGVTWTNIQTYSANQGSAANFASVTINLNTYINQANFKFRMRYVATWNDGWAVDDVVLSGDGPADTAFEWTPQTGLYTDAEATMPYTGGEVESIYANPEETTTYTASHANGIGSVVITVNNPLAPEVNTFQEFCHSATVGDLEDFEGVIWYESTVPVEPLDDNTPLQSGSVYLASQVIDGCEGVARTSVTVVITDPEAPAAAMETQSFCHSGTVNDLEAEGEVILWYADEAGGEPIAGDTGLIDDAVYYASQIVNGCESILRTAVTAHVPTVEAPTGEASQSFTVDEAGEATIEDIVVDYEGVVYWYASLEDMENNISLPEGTQLESGVTYYGIQVIGECMGMEWIEVTVTITVLGIDEFKGALFTYYPNPVKDVLTISHTSEISVISVYNMLGQEVLTKQINANEGNIDMSVLTSDAYMVNVTAEKQAKVIKVIKE